MKLNQIGPRTIKFQETVQIKEIEPNEDPRTTQTDRRASWDPTMNEVRRFFRGLFVFFYE